MVKKTLAERKSEKLAELAKIKQQIAAMDAKSAERIGKIALAAGLDELGLDDATLKKEFEAIASKFRGSQDEPPATPAAATEPN